jgi:hypothetical protein
MIPVEVDGRPGRPERNEKVSPMPSPTALPAPSAPPTDTPAVELLDTREVATRFRVTPATVRLWARARDGRLPPPVRIGTRGKLLWPADKVKAAIDGLLEGGAR